MVLNFMIGLFLYCEQKIISNSFTFIKIEKDNLLSKKVLAAVILITE